MKNFTNRTLILLIIVSGLLSLGYSFFYKIKLVVDAQAYDKIAVNIMQGRGFKENPTLSYKFDPAILRAGPGYEFFLAGIYKIFGYHYEAVWIIQAMLHAFSAFLLFLICKKIFFEHADPIGLIAAALFGLHPDLIEISAMLMTETLYLFLIILMIYFFVNAYYRRDSFPLAGLLGGVTGLAILTRPPVILFVPAIVVMYLLVKRHRQMAVFLIAMALTLVPWTIRNFIIYHQFIFTTLIGEYNLWIGNTLLSNGGQIASGFNPLTAYTTEHGFFGLKAEASRVFWAFVLVHPFFFLKLCFLRIIRFFSLIRPMGFWFYQSGIKQLIFIIASALAIILLFISGFSGMILAWRERHGIFRYLIVLAATAPLVLIPTVVESRYRFQIYPFLSIFGAYFIVCHVNKIKASNKILIGTASLLIINSGIDAFSFWPVIAAHIKLFSK